MSALCRFGLPKQSLAFDSAHRDPQVNDHLLNFVAAASNRFDLWQRILQTHGVTSMAEVGVWHGAYSAEMLQNCPSISKYYLIDPWRPLDDWNKPLNVSANKFAEAHSKAMASVAFAGQRVVVLRGTTLESADQIPDASLDAVYIDGDHTLRGITIDLIRMLPKLRPDGLLGGDDFMPDPWHHGAEYEPTLVAPFASHFAEALELPFVALPYHQFVIRNRPGEFSFTNLSGLNHSRRVGTPASIWRRASRYFSHSLRAFFSRCAKGN